ncbi:putative sugar nucleotidyl transferase [Rhodohalobacter mucosus]|uniref:Glucose-1-phosphate thymidylyltransferase n=1 Tax=Rhodohalobacter mucosus TaxID=2079485 RepID=A0A316TS31_9BACT|nr:putative sugar nucleotidyl transferase [Rhodohalobacter mucosus]PWN07357.1 glucose-1-phosphate thymidylyltransferase [Rhodohalobacter mucosus]
MNIDYCLFEDEFLDNFHPLTLTRPMYDLRVGVFTLAEKWSYALKSDRDFCGPLREHLKGVFPEPELKNKPDGVLWINPRYVPLPVLADRVRDLDMMEYITHEGILVAALVDLKTHRSWMKKGIQLNSFKGAQQELHETELVILKNIWELFQMNGEQILFDISISGKIAYGEEDIFPHTVFTNPDRIYIEEGAKIEPGAMLLADNGPIYIGKNAHIMANSIIRGPSAICEKSVVKMGARIYEDTTIGPVCKVGGEISNSIFHSYSNKAHDGYAGNSVFGQWCNLGADTNTSNLKNNYSSVKVSDWKTGRDTDTGQQFIGTIMGDHSKTGINSMLNTGTLCGVCCNLFSDGYPPKHVPSFSWVSGHDMVPYHFEKAVEAMSRMMERRSITLTPAYEKMMKAIFESTSF